MTMNKPLFDKFVYDPKIIELEAYQAIKTKYCQRLLMSGRLAGTTGPFVEPEVFFGLTYPDETVELMNTHFGKIEDDSIDPAYQNSDTMIGAGVLTDRIISDEIALPLVFKPNNGALGDGIYFLERGSDGEIIVTTGLCEGSISRTDTGILHYLMNSDGSTQVDAGNPNIFQAIIDDPERLFSMFAYGAVLSMPYEREDVVSGKKIVAPGIFDSGMVESFVNCWKVDGMCYETRHRVFGNVATGKMSGIKYDYARIGGSNWFSNNNGIIGARRLSGSFEKMFAPLLNEFVLGSQERKGFEKYVSGLLTDAFLCYGNSLRGEGFIFDHNDSSLEFDLMWMPPKDGGYPVPFLTECSFSYRNPDMAAEIPSKLRFQKN
jgi:hypothetical protein